MGGFVRANFRVYAAIVLSMVFWAFSFVWFKIANEVFQPISIITLRLILSTALLGITFGFIRKLQPIDKADRKWFLLLAFLEPFLYFMGESYGLLYVTSTQASVIVSTIPLFSTIAAFVFYGERLTRLNIVGIAISVTGVTLIVLNPDLNSKTPLVGIVLMMLAVFSAVAYAVVVKKLSARYNAFTLVTVQNAIGIFMFLPFLFVFEWKALISTPVTTSSVLAIIQLAVFASTMAFLLFIYGIQKIGISRASVFTNSIPVFTALFAWWLLSDPISLQKVLGIVLAISGLYVSQLKTKND
jgi:drug/metabolite transporter (DMT)-like permease